MSATEPREINIRELQRNPNKETMSIWAMNRSDRGGTQERGRVFIAMRINDEDQDIEVPNTWIPIPLSEIIPAADLIKSPSFLRNVASGLITLHDAEECEEFMKQPEAKREWEVIRKRTHEKTAILASETLVDNDGDQKQEPSGKMDRITEKQAAGFNDNESEGILHLVRETLTGDFTEERRNTVFRTNASKLNNDDLEYISKRSTSASLVSWATKLLAERKGGGGAAKKKK